MNRRVWLSGFLVMVCLATLWGVWNQRGQVAGLRAEQQQLLAQLAAREEGAATGASALDPPPPTPLASPELLRLRSEVTRLTERRRELASVGGENARLKAQLASRGTIGPAGFQPPPGYVRRSEARMMGFNTPEDTLQTLLWAIHNRDLNKVLQVFTPEQAAEIQAHAGRSQSTEDFFRQAAAFAGMRVVKREQDANTGSIALEVEIIPGQAGPRITFQQTNGQWRIAGPL